MSGKLIRQVAIAFLLGCVNVATLLAQATPTAGESPGAASPTPVLVQGVVVDGTGRLLKDTGLLLLRVRLFTMSGTEVTTLPAKEQLLVFAQKDPPLEARTNAHGQFAFRGVSDGLWAIRLQAADGKLLEASNKQAGFQVKGQSVDLGKVTPQ